MKVLVLLALVGLAVAGPLQNLTFKERHEIADVYANGYIVGGVAATAGQAPYIVSLQRSSSHFCGGTIIDANWIVTAAHCVVGVSASALTVRYNTLTYNSGGSTVGVSNVYTHESYSSSTINNDIALLRTSSALTLGTTNAQKVPLPAQGSDVTSGSVTVSGWGTLTEGSSSLPTALQIVTVPVVSRTQCNTQYGSGAITTGMFCAGILGTGGQDACQGDSGGPVIQDGVLVGAVSWGNGCARPNYPGVYTRVGNYITWISSKGAPVS